jgi:hypothetical protein
MPGARGIALAEVLTLVACAAVAAPPVVVSLNGKYDEALRIRDQMQVGRIVTTFEKFALTNNGSYPLPSALDTANTTVREFGEFKNNTGNILSILIFNGFLTPEELIGPAESATGTVVVDTGYEYERPSHALVPKLALWDPGFSGTQIDFNRRALGLSNQSYAHIIPLGRRAEQWRTNSATLRPLLGNRGPQYAVNDSASYPANGHWSLVQGPLGVDSNTLLIHGPRNTWEGLVGFNDLHVEYWQAPTSTRITYRRAAGAPQYAPDNLFVNENDELGGDSGGGIASGRNAYLRPISRITGTPSFPVVLAWRD